MESAGTSAALHRLTPTLLAVILPVGAGPDGSREAMRVAERLRRDVESNAASPKCRTGNTISAGVAVHGANRFESPDALLRAAMLALGAAQRGGRNRVGLFKPAHDPMTAAQQIR